MIGVASASFVTGFSRGAQLRKPSCFEFSSRGTNVGTSG